MDPLCAVTSDDAMHKTLSMVSSDIVSDYFLCRSFKMCDLIHFDVQRPNNAAPYLASTNSSCKQSVLCIIFR